MSWFRRVLSSAALAAAAVIFYTGLPAAAQFGAPQPRAREVRPRTGDAVTDALAQLHWREIGPANMGGRVTAIVGVPGDPKTFWVGAADGGVWKTTDAGTTFQPTFEDYWTYSIGALALAPSDHNVLWLGSGEGDPRNSVSYGNGVYRSTDGGLTWTHLGLDDTERIKRIVVHPKDPDTALVCALGHEWGANEERGIFKTTDAGKTWTKVLYIDQDTGCSDLAMDLSNPRNLYAGMWTHRRKPWRFDDGGKETAVYVSRDLGETWRKITTTPNEPMARPGLHVAQSSPNVVYLVTEYPTAGTLFRSDDYGETWRMVNDDRNINFRPFYYSDVIVDPNDEDTVFVISGGNYKSTDGGRTFQRVAAGTHSDHQALWIDPEDSDRILLGTDGGYQVSYDGGINYHIFRNISMSQFYQIFVDDQDPYWVCGGLQDNGNWCGPSRSKAGAILNDDWFTVSGGDGFYTVPVPGKPHIIYSNSQGGYFNVTDTKSGRTRSIPPYPRMIGSQGQAMNMAKYRFNWNAPIHISPHDPSVTYWGGNVLFRSRDEFYTWEIISPDLSNAEPHKLLDSGGEIYNDNTAAEFHATILTIAESPREKGVIWVGTDDGNVQVTRNDGASWAKINANIPGFPKEAWVGKIDASHHVNGRAYVIVDQHRLDDFTPHAWRCDDYGARCVDIAAGLPQDDYVIVVREDPKNPDVLYAGMERGIQVSIDGGKSWHDLRLNLPRVSVRDIKIHPRENDLVIGTHGRGAFILDDITPIQQLASAMRSDFAVFPIRRATNWENWNKDSNLGSSTWQGENPPNGALINYWLRNGGPATVTITDKAGSVVSRFTHRGQPGVNRAVWNMRFDNPAGMPAGGRGGRGGGSLAALPGTYTATVAAGDYTASQTFELRGDPDVSLSLADYEAQHEAALRARTLAVDAGRLSTAVDDLTEQVEAAEAQVKKANLPNASQLLELTGTAKSQLDELQNKLRRPRPTMNYRVYPRLTEEIRTILGGLTGAQARPTQGLLTALGELETEKAERAKELEQILNTTIKTLNEMLGQFPKIVAPGDR